jgi:ParB-like chromosome segregation protein Spo0J
MAPKVERTRKYEHHPLADLFPPMSGEQFKHLVDDIRERGLLEPITIHEDKVLDGVHRLKACAEAGVQVRTTPLRNGINPLDFVISKNLSRRHLDTSQRAMVAAKIATLRDGQRQVGKFAHVPTQAEAAKLLNVSPRSVKNAAVVRDCGSPELQQAVDSGEVPVSAGATIARMPKDEQARTVKTCQSTPRRSAPKRVTSNATTAATPSPVVDTALLEFADFVIARTPKSRVKGSGISIKVDAADVKQFDSLLDNAEFNVRFYKRGRRA